MNKFIGDYLLIALKASTTHPTICLELFSLGFSNPFQFTNVEALVDVFLFLVDSFLGNGNFHPFTKGNNINSHRLIDSHNCYRDLTHVVALG